MNFDSPQPSSTYPPREHVCSSVLIDLPTNPEFTELIKRKSEKLLFHKAQIREGSSPNPVPMSCILVLNNDRNERLKLKINNEIVWKNDGVPIIAADLGGNALVEGLSCGMRSGADYVVGDMDSSSPSLSSSSFDEKVREKRRTLAQMKRGEGNDEKMPFVNREQVRKRRFDDSDDTASGDNDDDDFDDEQEEEEEQKDEQQPQHEHDHDHEQEQQQPQQEQQQQAQGGQEQGQRQEGLLQQMEANVRATMAALTGAATQ